MSLYLLLFTTCKGLMRQFHTFIGDFPCQTADWNTKRLREPFHMEKNYCPQLQLWLKLDWSLTDWSNDKQTAQTGLPQLQFWLESWPPFCVPVNLYTFAIPATLLNRVYWGQAMQRLDVRWHFREPHFGNTSGPRFVQLCWELFCFALFFNTWDCTWIVWFQTEENPRIAIKQECFFFLVFVSFSPFCFKVQKGLMTSHQ